MRQSVSAALLFLASGSGLCLPACAQVGAPVPLPDVRNPQVILQAQSTLPSSVPGRAQTTVPPSSQSGQPAPQQGAGGKPAASSEDQLKAEEKQRLLGIVPAFNTVQSGEAAPLKPGQKFDLWYHSAIDPFTFAVAGIDGGLEQAEDTYPEYGQGAEGFAKRFGAAYADSVDGNFWGNAVLPVLLHQDPRYFRLGQGTIKRRLWYAAISTVRCKGDNGKWQPSYSNIGGNLIGGAISNVYYPAADRGVGLTLSRGLTVTAEGAFGAVAFEFYPDLIGYVKRRHHANVGPSVPSANAPGTPQAPAAGPQL